MEKEKQLEPKLLRRELFRVKCPRRIVAGDPYYFETEPPERLKKLVVDYIPPRSYEARLVLSQYEMHDFGVYQTNAVQIYLAPGKDVDVYAAEKMYANLEENRKHLYELKQYFVSHIGEVDGAVVNACDASAVEETAPHIVSVSFDGVRSEVLLHALEEKEIYVSSGSACSSNHPGISGTLKAIGVANERLDCTLRFSFSVETQIEQLKQTITELKQLVPVLARYTRR